MNEEEIRIIFLKYTSNTSIKNFYSLVFVLAGYTVAVRYSAPRSGFIIKVRRTSHLKRFLRSCSTSLTILLIVFPPRPTTSFATKGLLQSIKIVMFNTPVN